MTTFEALVLGVVQGVTEFLPISSTAHLRIVPALAGWGDPGAAFTAVLQLGTLVAVVGYFLPDLLRMLRAAIAAVTDRSRPPEPPARMLGYIIVGTLPVGVAGIVFKHAIEGSLRSLWVISAALIVVALALALVERRAPQPRLRRHPAARRDDHRLRAGAGAGAGRVALGDHAGGGAGDRPAARRGRAVLVPARRAGRSPPPGSSS